MAYAFLYDVPGDEGIYQKVKAEIGDDPAPGLLVQMVLKRDGGLRHVGVWDSKEGFERFQRETVLPAVARVLRSLGVEEAPHRPAVDELNLVDVIRPA
jgi:hypothetical protein